MSEKKPLYARWGFWAIMVWVLIFAIGALTPDEFQEARREEYRRQQVEARQYNEDLEARARAQVGRGY